MRLIGRLKRSLQAVPKSVLLGVGGVALAFVASAGIYATALPWTGASDSGRHVEYVYSLHQGQLLDPWQPIYDIHLDDPKQASQLDRSYPNGSAAHPPLHYAMMSLLTGDLLEAGDWQLAVAIMRLVNILIGAISLGLIAWAGWKLGGRHRQFMAVAAPALSGLITPFVIVAADVYNEPLTVLLATAMLAVTAVCLKQGPSYKLVGLLAVLASLGMLTKVSIVSTISLALVFVGLAFFIHYPNRWRALWASLATAAVVGLSVVLTSGWFYLRNYQLSGSWFRAFEKYQVVGRDKQTMIDVLSNQHFWGVLPEGLLGIRSWQGVLEVNKTLSVVIFLLATIGFILIAAKALRAWRRSARPLSRRYIIIGAIIGLMVLQVIALYAQQLQHSIGWGLINPRYFLTSLLPVGLFFAIAALVLGSYRSYLIAGLVLVYSLAAMFNLAYMTGGLATGSNLFAKLNDLLISNGLPTAVLYILVTLAGLGVMMVFVAVRNIERVETSKS